MCDHRVTIHGVPHRCVLQPHDEGMAHACYHGLTWDENGALIDNRVKD